MAAPDSVAEGGMRRVVVLGGTRGIGRAIVEAFLGHGDLVLATGRSPESVATLADGLAGTEGAGRLRTAAVDTAAPELPDRLAGAVEDALGGGVDVLCCNAGVFPSSPLDDLDRETITSTLQTNLVGHMLAVQRLAPLLRRASQGRVILTSSITGPLTGYPGWTTYAASKAAQLGFMRSAALELAPHGVTVNAVLPGNIATEGLVAMGPEYLSAAAACVPLGKLGTPEDIAHAVIFLASAGAQYITGQTIVVDGGQTLPESPDAILPLASAPAPEGAGAWYAGAR